MAKVKVFLKQVKQNVKVTYHSRTWKILSQGIYMWDMKALHLYLFWLRKITKDFCKVVRTSRSGSLGIPEVPQSQDAGWVSFYCEGLNGYDKHSENARRNTERLKFQDFYICPNISHVDADPDADAGGIAIAIVRDPRSIALHLSSRGSQRQISRLRVCQNREIWLVALRNLTAIFSQSQWTFLTSLRLWTIMSASTPAERIRHFTGFAVLISGVFGVFRKKHPHKLVDTRLALV